MASPVVTDVPAGTIVVGIDGSPGADQALDWAVDQAVLERRTLTLVHAAHVTVGGSAVGFGQPGIDVGRLMEEVRVAGQCLLDDAEQHARLRARRNPHLYADELVVRQVLSTADPRTALRALAERAAVVVVGSRGRGPIASTLLGSVSVHVAKHAGCPVVVVRRVADTPARGGVVVDVDATDDCRAAIEYAYRTASLRALPLTALHVMPAPDHHRDDQYVVLDSESGLDAERQLLSEATAGMREKFPDVQDHLELVRGRRERQLVRASIGADLLVIGTHHRNPVDDALFGSVSAVIERSVCDVAVVTGGSTTES